MIKILLVEDDKTIVANLTEYLNGAGYIVRSVSGQSAAIAVLAEERADLVLLDVSLAEGNGFSACKAIKSEFDLPVIFLTASGDEYSTVTGFDLGADDYLAKPFGVLELIARINAKLRKTKPDGVLTYADIVMDGDSRSVTVAGNPVSLTLKEYSLLRLFLSSPGKVLGRDLLLDSVWGVNYGETRTLDIHIGQLRKELSGSAASILTVRGVGYMLK